MPRPKKGEGVFFSSTVVFNKIRELLARHPYIVIQHNLLLTEFGWEEENPQYLILIKRNSEDVGKKDYIDTMEEVFGEGNFRIGMGGHVATLDQKRTRIDYESFLINSPSVDAEEIMELVEKVIALGTKEY